MTDTPEPTNADMAEDTVIDTDIAPPVTARDTATGAVMLVTAEDAATMAGVSVRTIRRWIQQGHLPATESESGKLVSPADLPTARQRAGRSRDRSHGRAINGHDRSHDNTDRDTDAATDTAMAATLSSSATAQMEAIRDEWLRPLIDRIEELSRENGRLEQERDTLRTELDQVRAAASAAENAPENENTAPQRDEASHMDNEPLPGVSVDPVPAEVQLATGWRRWWRRVMGYEG